MAGSTCYDMASGAPIRCDPTDPALATGDPSDPNQGLDAQTYGIADQVSPPSDPQACHDYCDSKYGGDSAVWVNCVARCTTIPPQSCDLLHVGSCVPNYVPLPYSPATAPVPLNLKLGAGGLVLAGLVVLVAIEFAKGAGAELASRV